MDESTNSFDAKSFLKTLPDNPGVYRMYDTDDDLLYVGKARNLKKRVANYFRKTIDDEKTRVMVSQITRMEVTLTASDHEALLLESNLIKKLKPRYNVLLRDDKSYPYILLTSDHDYPRLTMHRGAKKTKGKYYGPFPNSYAVRETINLLQKIFLLRQCDNTFFSNRSRPCLQYQIKRCSGPCVDLMSKESYAESVKHAKMFLEGKDEQVIEALQHRMDEAAKQQAYESAAQYRDQIGNLRKVQATQSATSLTIKDTDVITAINITGCVCVEVLFIRAGRLLGNRSYFPKVPSGTSIAEVISAFLTQHYLTNSSSTRIPSTLVLSEGIAEQQWLEQAMTQARGSKVEFAVNVRGDRARWVKLAILNAEQAITTRLADKATLFQRFEALQDALKLEALPNRIECFDISHTSGEATTASCVVFGNEGAIKSDYRRFNIDDITPGDDYAALDQAVTRRFKRLKESHASLPDVLLIDGGKGQLHRVQTALLELQVEGVQVVCVAKGPERKPGLETLFIAGDETPIHLPTDDIALHLIQQIRDEAHRFAITGHRTRRSKARQTSSLEGIVGVGASRRRALLKHFGGLTEIKQASVDDLAKVKGISRELAERIFAALH